MKYERYLVFGYDPYYPYGGVHDIMESFDNLDLAIHHALESDYYYMEIFDCDERKIVFVWTKEK